MTHFRISIRDRHRLRHHRRVRTFKSSDPFPIAERYRYTVVRGARVPFQSRLTFRLSFHPEGVLPF
jgi:hypothetical protein